MTKYLNYIGQLIAIPTGNNTYSLGLITIANEIKGIGVFFDEVFDELPTLADIKLAKSRIAFVKFFSLLGIDEGKWIILGKYKEWNKDDWNYRRFVRRDVLTNEIYIITYNDKLQEINKEKAEGLNTDHLPNDGLAGYGFIEKKLKKL